MIMLERLEKKYGRYAVNNLIYYILGAYVVGYILYLAKPEWYSYIVLDPGLVMKGQVWRLFTWVCTIPQQLNILIIFMFMFYFFIGRTLEQYMGSFKYNLYILSGWLFTTLGVMAVYWISSAATGGAGPISISASTYYINLTSFLAFAVIFPDTRVLFFAIIPVKMKILAWIDAVYLGIQVISGLVICFASDNIISQALFNYYGAYPGELEVSILRRSGISTVVSIVISVLNFLIFFFAVAKKRSESRKRKKDFTSRMEEGRQFYYQGQDAYSSNARQADTQSDSDHHRTSGPAFRKGAGEEIVHICSVCGRTSITNPELMFRYCSKCSGEHEYCQDHLFTHEHVKQ